jgi:hypothetical protein
MRLPLLFALACGATSLVAGSIAAQSPSADDRQPHAIAMPDTLGADFSIADSATGTASLGDFDFLIGRWRFRFQEHQSNGTWNPTFTGQWSARRNAADSGFIEDHWRGDRPNAPEESGTYTYRTFDRERHQWVMMGVATGRGGKWAPGLVWTVGDTRYAIQHYGSDLVRIRYFAITPNHFLWRADASTDGGRTWQRDHWTMEAFRLAQ